MKKIYIIITALAISAGSFAQTADSLLRRQMELERDYNPTLLDADKINSLPALREPSVQRANTNYSNWAGRTTPPLEIALSQPGDIMTAIPFNRKRGFISLNAGNYANIDGAFGYRLVENEKNNLAFTFLHNSTNGDIKFVQESDGPSSNNAYVMDNEGRLGYRHLADALTLNIELSYLHSLFNYYGNSFGDREQSMYGDKKQQLGLLNAKVGVVSQETDLLNYNGYIQVRNFSTAFGELPESDGLKGSEVNAMVGINKPFGNSGTRVGVDGKVYTAIYNDYADNFFLTSAAPYIYFGNTKSHARLGADVIILNFIGSKVRVAPHVKTQLAITKYASIYANIHGGFSNNTFIDMLQESRYIRPYGNVRPSYSIVDIDAGIKIGDISGFRFDIFGGFTKTDDEHFLVMNGQDLVGGDVLGAHRSVLKPIYGDLSHTHIGGMIQSNVWAPLDISLRIKQNFYTISLIRMDETEIEDPKAYNKPGFEADIRAALSLTDSFKLTANYYFAGDRWSYFDGGNSKMDNINDLNAGALYQISESFSLNVRVNNLLSQKYDIWYGFPAQGINASGGFSFRF